MKKEIKFRPAKAMMQDGYLPPTYGYPPDYEIEERELKRRESLLEVALQWLDIAVRRWQRWSVK